jgi:hypothetical protein
MKSKPSFTELRHPVQIAQYLTSDREVFSTLQDAREHEWQLFLKAAFNVELGDSADADTAVGWFLDNFNVTPKEEE